MFKSIKVLTQKLKSFDNKMIEKAKMRELFLMSKTFTYLSNKKSSSDDDTSGETGTKRDCHPLSILRGEYPTFESPFPSKLSQTHTNARVNKVYYDQGLYQLSTSTTRAKTLETT